MKTQTVAIVAVIGVVTVLVATRAMAQSAATAAGAVVDYGAGLMSGNNGITSSARTSAYEGAGVFGTLGAATDAAFGGVLSQAGEVLGGFVYNVTH